MIQMQKKLLSLEDGLEEFKTECKVKNLSNDTIGYYEENFGYFTVFLNGTFENLDIKNDITKQTVKDYIVYMKAKELKETTINIRLRGIRSILYYFMENNYVDTFKIQLLKQDETIPEVYTDEEIRKLLKKPNMKTCSFSEYRTWAVESFFVATGVRSKTLRYIEIKDLDFENELIRLTTMKGRKMVFIPMSKSLKKVLIEYLRIRGGEPNDYLFCNLEGKQLTKYALGDIISKYNKKRGVDKTGVHLFRHYFAKVYIQNGGNALKLQKLLAHSTLEQTQHYVNLYGKDLQKDYDHYNPLDQLNICSDRIKMRTA